MTGMLPLPFLADGAAAAPGWTGAFWMPMGEVPMAGGWSMSAMWMPMCGQTWQAAARSFVLMWTMMMACMMLPSLWAFLRHWQHGRVVRRHECGGAIPVGAGSRQVERARQEDWPGRAVAVLCLVGGHLSVWAAVGAAVFVAGALVADAALRVDGLARALPAVAALATIGAGLYQFSVRKALHLHACAARFAGPAAPSAHGMRRPRAPMQAVAAGWRLGAHCVCSCAGLTVALIAHGCMEVAPMLLATAAITWERLTPHPDAVRRALGVLLVALGFGTL